MKQYNPIKTIRITPEQVKWIHSKSINLSMYIRAFLDEQMNQEKEVKSNEMGRKENTKEM